MTKQEALRGLAKRTSARFEKARERGRMPNTGKGRTVWVTSDQYETVLNAIRAVREDASAPSMSEGMALEYICADFLSGS